MNNNVNLTKEQSSRIFIWNDFKNWKSKALEILHPLIDQEVLEHLKRYPPRSIVSDNLSWLDKKVKLLKGVSTDTKLRLAEGILNNYDFVRCFHGCRPISIESYREKGIQPCVPEELQNQAFDLFKGHEKRIREIIQYFAECRQCGYEGLNRGSVFFCLTSEELIGDCGHYLLYGSEYLAGIADHLRLSHVMRQRGRATMIECNVPIQDIPKSTITELAGDMLEYLVDQHLDLNESSSGEICIKIKVPLKPENIVNFHYPTGIPNPKECRMKQD